MPPAAKPAVSPTPDSKPQPDIKNASQAKEDDPAKNPTEPELLPDDGRRDWIAQLADSDSVIRSRAAEELDSWGDEAIPELLRSMKDTRPQVRAGAMYGLLGYFDPSQPDLVSACLVALSDSDPAVRTIALRAVGQLNRTTISPALPQLVQMLQDQREQPHNRAQIARMLGQRAPAAACNPALRAALRSDPDREVRVACLIAVLKQTTTVDDAVETLRLVLKEDTDAGLQRLAASRLTSFGPAAAPALPELLTALDTGQERVQMAAADALVQIGPTAVTELSNRLTERPREVRILAILTLGRMGQAGRAVLPQLRSALKDPDQAVREAAQVAIRLLQQ